MAEEGKPDAQLFQLLSGLLQQIYVGNHLQHVQLRGEWWKRKFVLYHVECAIFVKHKICALDIGRRGFTVGFNEKVEALTNQEEVELRTKIEALGLEVTKLPSKSTQHLDELEIAKELDKLSAKLDDVDEMISSAMAEDPQVKSLLSDTADIWMPVITATTDERRNFTASITDDVPEAKGKSLNS